MKSLSFWRLKIAFFRQGNLTRNGNPRPHTGCEFRIRCRTRWHHYSIFWRRIPKSLGRGKYQWEACHWCTDVDTGRRSPGVLKVYVRITVGRGTDKAKPQEAQLHKLQDYWHQKAHSL